MRRNRVTQRDILFLSISMFVMVTAWIAFNSYHAWATSTISADLQIQIKPIDPNFDTATIKFLKTKDNIAPLFDSNTTTPPPAASSEAIPEITAAPTPIASGAAESNSVTPPIIPTESPTSQP